MWAVRVPTHDRECLMACTARPGSCASKLEVSQHSQQAAMGLGQGSAGQCCSSVSLNLLFIP